MFLTSLSARLIAAFAFVICLSLFLASSAFIFLLRGYQTELALNRLADLTLPVSFISRTLERGGMEPRLIAASMAEEAHRLGVRILLIDSEGQIVGDTQGALLGQGRRLSPGQALNKSTDFTWGVFHDGNQRLIYLIAANNRPAPLPRGAGGQRPVLVTNQYRVVIAAPEQSISAAWLELGPSLSAAAALSLVISVLVSAVLGRSISRPLREITRASDAMARGEYDQAIKVKGRDEVAQLAEAFNRMALEVGRSHRTLRAFLANVSHELRTPLTSIQGFSQALVDGAAASPEDQREAAEVIHQEAERMRRLVDDLLYLSKIESGQVALRREVINIGPMLEAATRRARLRAEENGVTMRVEYHEPVGVNADEGRLSQVLDNLLDNALKFTPTGGAVTISASAGSQSGKPVAQITVHNSGSFISEDDLPHIFDRFYQVDRSRARSNAGSGAGLGLAIAKEIVLAHGGQIVARSDPANGTAITLTLPLAAADAEAPQPTERSVQTHPVER